VISPRHRPLPVLPPPRRRGQRRDPAPARRRPGALRQPTGRECSLAAGPGPLTPSLVKSARLLLPRFPSSFARQQSGTTRLNSACLSLPDNDGRH
jgi:hypothetical protein